jgi:predicted RNase H-like HicB family nuclease
MPTHVPIAPIRIAVRAAVPARSGSLPSLSSVLRIAVVKLTVVLERDETGMIVAECPAIPGCVSQGSTEDEALANIKDAIVGCLEVRSEQGLPLTVRTVEVDVAVA